MSALSWNRCGNNYGWSRFEGSRCQEAVEYRDGPCLDADRSGFTFPIYEYCHPDYYADDEGEDAFTDGVDICGGRLITGHAVMGTLSSANAAPFACVCETIVINKLLLFVCHKSSFSEKEVRAMHMQKIKRKLIHSRWHSISAASVANRTLHLVAAYSLIPFIRGLRLPRHVLRGPSLRRVYFRGSGRQASNFGVLQSRVREIRTV